MTPQSPTALVLRAALACAFFGHGVFALLVNPAWFPFYAVFGFSVPFARATMPLVGALDLVVVAALVCRPVFAVLAWCAVWTVFTALLRPLSGAPISELLVRAMNFGPAIALVILHRQGSPTMVRVWLAIAIGSVAVGALLGGSLFPRDPRSALEWVERAGAVGLPLAAALTFATPERHWSR